VDQSPWDPDVPPFAWDSKTGLSRRPIPGQRGGEYVLTGLAHDEESHVAYDSADQPARHGDAQPQAGRSAQRAQATHRARRPEGDLLVVGWGSTLGAIEEAVDRLRAEGHRVSSVHLRFLSPMEPGLREIFSRFRKVMTVEINYSDEIGRAAYRRGVAALFAAGSVAAGADAGGYRLLVARAGESAAARESLKNSCAAACDTRAAGPAQGDLNVRVEERNGKSRRRRVNACWRITSAPKRAGAPAAAIMPC
jgi:pyruvate/2-oxoacid:ferredoxin oxidoreductase alpha subunit